MDASLFDSAIAFAIWDICEFWGTGRVPRPLGTGNRMSAPYQAIRAKDDYFVFGANNDRLWRQLCELLDRPELLNDPRFRTIVDRLANRDFWRRNWRNPSPRRPRNEWMADLLARGIPAGPIYDYEQALGSDHAAHRGTVMEIDHPIEGRVRSIGFPIKLSETKQSVRRHPPLLGEHTDEVLRELGFSAGDVEQMRAAGEVG